MNCKVYKANQRGYFKNEWLETKYSFSFSDWFDRNRMNFGVLRVFNDDVIKPNSGFGMHPHNDMEIITIVLEGSIKHIDSMNNEEIISKGEIQVMSTGSGIFHSEFNPYSNQLTKLFQIWIYPNKEGINPEYNQSKFDFNNKNNKFLHLIGPKNENYPLTINQNAYLSFANISKNESLRYDIKKTDSGTFIMNIEGKLSIENNILNKRDTIEITDFRNLNIFALEDSKFLLIEVPMERKYA